MVALALILLAANPEPVRLVVPAFTVTGMESGPTAGWSDQVQRELTRRGLSLQREGEADGTLVGGFSAVDEKRVLVHLQVLSAKGELLAAASLTAPNADDVPGIIDVLARELVTQLRPKFEAGRIPNELGKLKRTHAIAPGVAAGIFGGLGGWMLSPSQGDHTTGWVLIGAGVVALGIAIVILVFGDPP